MYSKVEPGDFAVIGCRLREPKGGVKNENKDLGLNTQKLGLLLAHMQKPQKAMGNSDLVLLSLTLPTTRHPGRDM